MNKTLRASLILPLLFLGHSLFGQAFNLRTKSLTVAFQVGHDGRLYQYPIGLPAGEKLLRDQESYPQAGDGYVWEPALEAVHADGNTSTALLFEGEDQTHEPPDITLTRVHLRDAAYPFHVTLCFRSHAFLWRLEPGDDGTHHGGTDAWYQGA